MSDIFAYPASGSIGAFRPLDPQEAKDQGSSANVRVSDGHKTISDYNDAKGAEALKGKYPTKTAYRIL